MKQVAALLFIIILILLPFNTNAGSFYDSINIPYQYSSKNGVYAATLHENAIWLPYNIKNESLSSEATRGMVLSEYILSSGGYEYNRSIRLVHNSSYLDLEEIGTGSIKEITVYEDKFYVVFEFDEIGHFQIIISDLRGNVRLISPQLMVIQPVLDIEVNEEAIHILFGNRYNRVTVMAQYHHQTFEKISSREIVIESDDYFEPPVRMAMDDRGFWLVHPSILFTGSRGSSKYYEGKFTYILYDNFQDNATILDDPGVHDEKIGSIEAVGGNLLVFYEDGTIYAFDTQNTGVSNKADISFGSLLVGFFAIVTSRVVFNQKKSQK